jgi:ECF transporter S component (folate family)
MFKRRNATRMLVTMALLSAIEVVLARFIVPMPNPTMRFSIEAVPIIVAGYLYGPVAGAIVGLVGDAVGTLFSGYGYNPLFAVPPMLIGLCSGLLRHLLYKKVSYLRILATFLPAVVLGSVLWQSYWLSFFYGTHSFVWFLGSRAVQFAITSAVNAAVIFGLFKSRVFDVLRLWPPVGAQAPAQENNNQASVIS